MTNKEIDEFCTYVLNRLRDLNQNLSIELTSISKEPEYRSMPKEKRKIEKVKLLYEREPALFQEIVRPLNIEWLNEPRSPTNFFDILDRKSDSLNMFGELTGGNYSGKV